MEMTLEFKRGFDAGIDYDNAHKHLRPTYCNECVYAADMYDGMYSCHRLNGADNWHLEVGPEDYCSFGKMKKFD